MQVCLIAPRSMLEWTTLGDMHFIVPLTADEAFYAKEEKYKIIDNGVYETGRPMSLEDFIQLALRVRADEIIIPDVMFNWEATYENAYTAFEEFKDKVLPFKTMIVPQAKHPAQWVDAYAQMTRSFPEAHSIGVPKWLDGRFHCRAAMMHYLAKTGKLDERPHHFLGVDNLADLSNLPSWAIRSCDTSKPFTYAYSGKALGRWTTQELKRVDLEGPRINPAFHDILRQNIHTLLEIAHT